MIHLRILVPSYESEHALDLLKGIPSVTNLVYLKDAARKPEGDVILCDVAREDASVVIGDLRELNIDVEGSIAIEEIDSAISAAAKRAEEAAVGMPSDAVVWEEVESRTSENTELSSNFVAFMALACLIASVGVMLDPLDPDHRRDGGGPRVRPDRGPVRGPVERRKDVAKRSLAALAVGFPAGIGAAFLFTLLVRAVGLAPDDFSPRSIR